MPEFRLMRGGLLAQSELRIEEVAAPPSQHVGALPPTMDGLMSQQKRLDPHAVGIKDRVAPSEDDAMGRAHGENFRNLVVDRRLGPDDARQSPSFPLVLSLKERPRL